MLLKSQNIAWGYVLPNIFKSASSEALKIFGIDEAFAIGALVVLSFVCAWLTYVLLKYKNRIGTPEPKQTFGSKKAEYFFIGIPILLVSFFFIYSVRVMNQTEPATTGQKPDVIITGHQWWWQFYYPSKHLTTANELHIPVGKRLLFELRSADVVHDWWVPAFGPKMDMIPGMKNHLWITVNKPGTYMGTCSEFCGQEHAWMRINVIAEPMDEYEEWLDENAEIASIPKDSTAIVGAHLFQTKTCGECHSINGTMAKGEVGPDLTHFASRQTLLLGLLPFTKENLLKWLSNPKKVKPGAHMPDFIFKKDSLNDIADYLMTLK